MEEGPKLIRKDSYKKLGTENGSLMGLVQLSTSQRYALLALLGASHKMPKVAYSSLNSFLSPVTIHSLFLLRSKRSLICILWFVNKNFKTKLYCRNLFIATKWQKLVWYCLSAFPYGSTSTRRQFMFNWVIPVTRFREIKFKALQILRKIKVKL